MDTLFTNSCFRSPLIFYLVVCVALAARAHGVAGWHHQQWCPSHDSALVVVWHNKFSMLRSKKVVFQASVREMEKVEEWDKEAFIEKQNGLGSIESAVPSSFPCPTAAAGSTEEEGVGKKVEQEESASGATAVRG